jgi:hypothetical protein
MIIGHHLILTGYGHWMPNDPRGSMSREVDSPKVEELGELHYGRKRVQPSREELREFHKRAERVLNYPVVWFEDAERQALARAVGRVVGEQQLTCYACAVLRCHVHLLIRRHRLKGEQMIHLLKIAGRDALREAGVVAPNHPVFSADSCDVYKSDVIAMRSCVVYVNEHYRKHRLTPIECDFVVPYDDWGAPKRRK